MVPPRLLQLLVEGRDLHSFLHHGGTGGDQAARSLDLHQAQAAGPRGSELAVPAEARDVDSRARAPPGGGGCLRRPGPSVPSMVRFTVAMGNSRRYHLRTRQRDAPRRCAAAGPATARAGRERSFPSSRLPGPSRPGRRGAAPRGRPSSSRARSASRAVPTRQGMHFPQDSWRKKSMMEESMAVMERSFPMTMTAPEPRVAPAFLSAS